MSKISEQKALETYPKMSRISETHGVIPADNKSHCLGDANEENREAFIKGYDQAMQDFMEKAERYLQNTLYDRVEIEVYGTIIPDIIDRKGFIENFKNYMQDEN